MRAHRLNVTVPDDHQLKVDLPGDFPPGPAEIIVLTEVPQRKNIVKLGGVLESSGPDQALGKDPIAETLEEFRTDRADFDERRARRYESDDPEP